MTPYNGRDGDAAQPRGVVPWRLAMRRFIVEVVIDALLLFFIALVLGVFSVSQPFPFGTESGPDHRAPRRRASSDSCRRQRS